MKKQLLAVAVAVVSMASLQAQVTQTNFSTGATNLPGYTGYFNSADGWTSGFWGGDNGWTQAGNADSVSVIAGYTPGLPAGNASGSLGVDYAPDDATIYVQKAFTPMSTGQFTNIATSFVTEFAVADLFAPNANDDTFRFSLRSGGTTALHFDLQAPGSFGFDYNLTSDGAGAPVAQFAMDYNSVYRMQIDITGSTWTGTLYGVTAPSTTRTITSLGSFVGGSLEGVLVASDIDNLRISWLLDSGDPNDLGTIGLIVNEATFTSTGDPIPEPGTWAVGALLLSGAAASIYRRRKAAKDAVTA